MSGPLTRHALKTYFDHLLFCPAHLPPAVIYVDSACGVWYGAEPLANAAPEHFCTAWVLRDLAVEAFTGEPSTLGLKVIEGLAEAAGIEDGNRRYRQLRHDLAPELPEFLGRMHRRCYGGRTIWPDHGTR